VSARLSSADVIARRQRAFIADARRLLKPNEVKLHKTPAWLTKRLRAYRKACSLAPIPSSMLLVDTLNHNGQWNCWLDHWGTGDGPYVCCHKSPCLISEPYDFGPREARDLNVFCREVGGIIWHVSPNAWWFPGSTVRITIHEERPL
jgi:hypothetical protein